MVAWLVASLVAQETQGGAPPEAALAKLREGLPALFQSVDKDGDGGLGVGEFCRLAPVLRKNGQDLLQKLDPSIAAKKKARLLKKYDADGNGRLDPAEARKQSEDEAKKPLKGDWDGDGQLDKEEQKLLKLEQKRDWVRLFVQIDADKNKQLALQEVEAALSRISAIKVKKAKTP